MSQTLSLPENLELNFQKDIEAVNSIEGINNILEVICKITGMGFAAVARVTNDRWITCVAKDVIGFGLKPGDELKVESTICHEIQQSHQPVVISNVSQHPTYFNHHTPKQYGLQSYISVPIVLKENLFFGTLCAIDPSPVDLDRTEILMMFELYANMIAVHLNSTQSILVTENSLKEEQETAELRDQFIAVLGHDLRNPVGAIRNSAQFMLRGNLEEKQKRLMEIILNSTFRISGLIDNILDFARGRLGDGIQLDLKIHQSLEGILNQVIAELKVITPDKTIITDYLFLTEFKCDSLRVAQLFSNLLGNAISYGDLTSPIIVKAISDQDKFQLCVHNTGEKIPDHKIGKMFEPFERGGSTGNKDGLGLGLYISAEIAKAHGGSLTVTSTDAETCFTLTIPQNC